MVMMSARKLSVSQRLGLSADVVVDHEEGENTAQLTFLISHVLSI